MSQQIEMSEAMAMVCTPVLRTLLKPERPAAQIKRVSGDAAQGFLKRAGATRLRAERKTVVRSAALWRGHTRGGKPGSAQPARSRLRSPGLRGNARRYASTTGWGGRALP